MPRHKPETCSGCALHDHGSDFSSVEGTGANGVLLVGEASGQHEQRDQLPFRPFAPAGGVLERCLRRMGLDRQQFSITNCIRCRPKRDWLEGSPWEYSALRSCRPNLDQVIAERKPRCIVALGGVAARELTGEAGEARGVTHLAGYVLPLGGVRAETICGHCEYEPRADCILCGGKGTIPAKNVKDAIPVLVDFHPSYLRRGKASHQGVFSRILKRSLDIAAGRDREWAWGIDPEEPSTWNTMNYWTHPTFDQCWSVYNYLRDNPQLVVAKDLETFESASMDEDARDGFQDTQIRTFQLSYQPGTGISIPYVEGYREVIRALVGLPNRFYGHNWNNFDHKVLRACAAREGWRYSPSDWCYDTLDMFHHWQPDLPAHLQFCASFIRFPFPWKHLAGTDIEFYGIADVDSDLRLGLWLEQMLRKDGIWGRGDAYDLTCGYTGQVREVRPVLAAMEDRGVPVDNDRRLALGAEFDNAAEQMISGREDENGRHIPGLMELFPDEAKKPEWYKTIPPEIKKLPESEWGRLFQEDDRWRCKCKSERNWKVERCEKCGQAREEGRIKPGKWYHYEQRICPVSQMNSGKTSDGGKNSLSDSQEQVRWCYISEFNPNSGKQLLEYMRSKKHPIPKSKEEDSEGNQKDTTAAKELQRLAIKTGDDFYLKVIEYRGLTKMRGTYVEGFTPAADGRVHTTFTFDTGIGQLSSRNPNVQNFPKLKPTPQLAKAMRGMIRAKRGYIITEWDYKSCHALTLSYLSESQTWMRMSRLDIHSIVAGHFLELWDARELLRLSDADIKGKCKWLKSDPERKRVRDDQAKHAILGIGNGLKAKGLYERYMEQFPPRNCPDCGGGGKLSGLRGMKQCPQCKGSGKQSGMSIASRVLEICELVAPEVFDWQRRMQDKAHREQFLRTEFGHIRRFYEVFRWDGKKSAWGHGDQAEEAIAFWLANIAFGHIREGLKNLDREGAAERYRLFNNVHDSYMFECPEELVEEHRHVVAEILLRPSEVLTNPRVAPGGLVIDVEASVGEDWGKMREIEVPRGGVNVVTTKEENTSAVMCSS